MNIYLQIRIIRKHANTLFAVL